MFKIDRPSKKVKFSRFLYSFFVSYFILFIFFLAVFFLLHMDEPNDFIFSLGIFTFVIFFFIQIANHLIDIYWEHVAIQEDWKKSEQKSSCCRFFLVPAWIKQAWFQLKIQFSEPLVLYSFYFDFRLLQQAWNIAVDNPESNSPDEHDALILIYYSPLSREYFSLAGLDLLIPFFIDNKINYRVYCCNNSDFFLEIVNNPKTTTLWIFGHGFRGGVRFFDKLINYSDLVNKLSEECKNKKYVYQFHCNSGCEKSLSEYIANGRGFANFQSLMPYAIRGYIKNILNDESWK